MGVRPAPHLTRHPLGHHRDRSDTLGITKVIVQATITALHFFSGYIPAYQNISFVLSPEKIANFFEPPSRLPAIDLFTPPRV